MYDCITIKIEIKKRLKEETINFSYVPHDKFKAK
jgi:hypothetical protein